MMLHEAVMLEIYRQALNASELASPRCQSRESSGSGGRCPSDDSNCSGNGSTSAGPLPTSPVGITLPATLPPAAAAALLPPQSAAMAAYLNVAAAAAQQNRLLLGNPLAAAAAGLVQAAQSPPNLPLASPIHPDDTSILDFSTKRIRKDSDTDSKSDSDAVNLSKSDNGEQSVGGVGGEYAPLDLSVGTKKRTSETPESPTLQRKVPRHTPTTQTPNQVPTSWVAPLNPYLAAVAAASLSPKNHLDWNGKSKISPVAPNDAAKALEKMSEMTRLGGPPENDVPMRIPNNQVSNNSTNNSSTGSTGRHSAWQSHWLNKGADAAKDVFKCVWCKQSFPTLASLTTHMKETQHCGVNVPPSGNLPTQQGNSGGSNQQQQHHHQTSQNTSSNSSNSSKSDLNLLIKETMPLPRKLVRGQDVWLGKGAEQTRQILKCMWCGQSFRSLAEMTSHMQQTQHYTNIISQEQIISWKSAEENKNSSGGGGNNAGQNPNANSNTNSTVSAVLTCKVCDQAFSSLKDLSNHMVKNAHYKEHIMRSITESGGRRRQTREKRKKSLPVRKLLELERAQHDFKNGDIKGMRPNVSDLGATTRITCEKCGDKIETALFVEHIRLCVGGQIANNTPRNNLMNKPLNANSIIPPDSMSPLTPTSSRDGRKSIGGCDDSATSPASSNRHISPHAPDLSSPISSKDGVGGGGGSGSIGGNSSGGEKSSPSVLNAIEQLIEKSFDTRSRHNTPGFSSNNHTSAPLGSSILKRLGIDESVDYTKPLIDPQTMSLLRSYQNSQYPRRERSGSESSSVSDRGSSRLESLTPERKPDMMLSNNTSPRESPDKTTNYSHSEHEEDHNNKNSSGVKVKNEPLDDENDEDAENNNCDENKNEHINNQNLNKEIKKEFVNPDEGEKNSHTGGIDDNCELDLSSTVKQKINTPSTSTVPSPNQLLHSYPSNSSNMVGNTASNIGMPGGSSITPAASPCSDRSTTPRSTTNSINNDNKKLSGSGSLNALSSMFDNLTGTGSIGSGNDSNNGCGNNGKKTTSHPLAALQKLCDKTETTSNNNRSNNSNALSASISSMGGSSPGNILAFSWACNDAVITQDSIIKCTLCDTPFCSKGAYRHHLSKVHFVKEEITDPLTSKSLSSAASSSSSSGNSSISGGGNNNNNNNNNGNNSNEQQHNRSASVSSNKSLPHSRSQSPKVPIGLNLNNNNNNNNSLSSSAMTNKSPSPSTSMSNPINQQQQQQQQGQQQHQQQSPASTQSPFDESPHSKFLKYTELAKQLSSKYV
ncbi:protein tiptop isoform X2 [Condylostylus longicornis]|uniref:protein tiptop isoform X2 n=1 Tax=Condylostylus longicornis TaxID=2530218 RepID=UPI00244DF8B8|nr:protein tiptop isoform X2 [Condylostylus longicornis]